MGKWKRWIVLAVMLALAVSLSACGFGGVTADDAVTYVQGELDAAYRGQYNEDYLELMDMTAEEASETHIQNVSAEALYLLSYIGVYDTESMPEDVITYAEDLIEQIYAKSNYTVNLSLIHILPGTVEERQAAICIGVERNAIAVWMQMPRTAPLPAVQVPHQCVIFQPVTPVCTNGRIAAF